MKIDTINKWLTVPSTDPDDARRRGLLNILLTGMAALALLTLLVATIAGIANVRNLFLTSALMLLGIIAILAINQYWSGELAGSLFVLAFTIGVVFTDEPQQVVNGRSLFLFTIPILMASIVLRPWASFAMAGVSSLVISILAITQLHHGVLSFHAIPFPTLLGLFAFAFVSWLSARSLESALQDLRALNQELDRRVEKRTQELREANRGLAEANERLRELDRLKSQLVSMVSHELRTPLNAIQGFAEMLEAGVYGSPNQRQQNALKRIEANAQQLLNLVNDLLDQARIEAGELSFDTAPFSPVDLISDVRSTTEVLADNKGLTLTTHVTPDVPDTLTGDRKRLRQILVNLANNAIKFTDEGSVHVQAYRPDANHWALDVSDTGPGIPPEKQEDIFEPFVRVDGSITREHTGTGLGLSIVKQLVELMNGSVELESKVGKGSTFTVILPINLPQEEAI